jgi:hypothetical protein
VFDDLGEGRERYLSMIVINGATRVAALAPETKSAASRRPRFLVFHTRGCASGFVRAGARVTFLESMSNFGAGDSSPGTGGVIVKSLTRYTLVEHWSGSGRKGSLLKDSADQLMYCINMRR